MSNLAPDMGKKSLMQKNICIICNSPVVFLHEVFDDRYGFVGRFNAVKCMHCGHISIQVDMGEQQIANLYTNFYPRSSFDVEAWTPHCEEAAIGSWWRGLRASAFRWVPRNVRVLDIGCGFGESLGYHRNRGCDASGVEADANILRVAQRHGLQVRVGLFDPQDYESASFDVVTLDQVIEHVADPAEVFCGVNLVLKPGGMLILSLPNAGGWGAKLFGRRWIHWHAPYHQQFFSRKSMAMVANEAGFVIESVRTVTNSTWLGYQWYHLATLPDEGHPSSFWTQMETPRTRWQKIAFKFIALADRYGINALLTRIFDALNIGDNLLCVMRKPSAK